MSNQPSTKHQAFTHDRLVRLVLSVGLLVAVVIVGAGCAGLREKGERIERQAEEFGELIENEYRERRELAREAGEQAAKAQTEAPSDPPAAPAPDTVTEAPEAPAEPATPPAADSEPIRITSWGKEPAAGATLDASAVLAVSPDGVKWRWDNDPRWKGYKLGSGREIIAVCYVAVPDGRGGWKAGKFDHWPKNLVARNRHNIEGGYAQLPVPSRGDAVYWFAVSKDKRKRTNFVQGRW